MSRMARCYLLDGQTGSESLRAAVRKSFPNLVTQAVDPSTVNNERLVEMVGEQTLEAVEGGTLLAQKPEVDLLMRLAGTTQIARAIQEFGVKPGENFTLVVVGDETDVARFESSRASGWTRLPRHELDKSELRRVERAALLNAEKA